MRNSQNVWHGSLFRDRDSCVRRAAEGEAGSSLSSGEVGHGKDSSIENETVWHTN